MSHALSVLSWLELQEEDQPPEEIWLDPEKLELHWEDVKARWAAKSGGEEPLEERPMWDNDLAKGWRNAR